MFSTSYKHYFFHSSSIKQMKTVRLFKLKGICMCRTKPSSLVLTWETTVICRIVCTSSFNICSKAMIWPSRCVVNRMKARAKKNRKGRRNLQSQISAYLPFFYFTYDTWGTFRWEVWHRCQLSKHWEGGGQRPHQRKTLLRYQLFVVWSKWTPTPENAVSFKYSSFLKECALTMFRPHLKLTFPWMINCLSANLSCTSFGTSVRHLQNPRFRLKFGIAHYSDFWLTFTWSPVLFSCRLSCFITVLREYLWFMLTCLDGQYQAAVPYR